MTVPRHEIFIPEEVGEYHCISRCVRRAFLCGRDPLSGISYEHRRAWVRDRLTFLVKIFAIDLLAYALMMNHHHTILRNRPDIATSWSDEEVALRWRTLFPRKRKKGVPLEPTEIEIRAITGNPDLVDKYRKRLSNISWFNRCLNEFIARMANKEDGCKGRFWEGRFKSQRIHDTSGLLACSVYIDLNPVRAGAAATPEDSAYTSVQDRIRALRGEPSAASSPPLLPVEEAFGLISTEEYLAIVDATGRDLVSGKTRISDSIAPILTRLRVNPDAWLDTTSNYRLRFRRVVGHEATIAQAAKRIGKQWFHGLAAARRAFT